MFRSVLGKGLAITLAIFGVVQLSAKMTVQTDIEEGAKAHQKEFFQQMKENRAEGERVKDAQDAKWKRHMLLEDIGRSLFSVKSTMERYKNKHSEWPEDMSDLGLQSETAADGKFTQSIKIDNGEIYAFLLPKFGEKKILRVFYTGGFQNKWSCTTNLSLDGKKTISGKPCSEKTRISFNGRHFQ